MTLVTDFPSIIRWTILVISFCVCFIQRSYFSCATEVKMSVSIFGIWSWAASAEKKCLSLFHNPGMKTSERGAISMLSLWAVSDVTAGSFLYANLNTRGQSLPLFYKDEDLRNNKRSADGHLVVLVVKQMVFSDQWWSCGPLFDLGRFY